MLAGCGAVTAVLLALRMRDGDYGLPPGLRLPLPSWMRAVSDQPAQGSGAVASQEE